MNRLSPDRSWIPTGDQAQNLILLINQPEWKALERMLLDLRGLALDRCVDECGAPAALESRGEATAYTRLLALRDTLEEPEEAAEGPQRPTVYQPDDGL